MQVPKYSGLKEKPKAHRQVDARPTPQMTFSDRLTFLERPDEFHLLQNMALHGPFHIRFGGPVHRL